MPDNVRTLGVLGGLGPMATVYFMEMVTRLTRADADQQHIPMIVISDPTTPDRTAFILGKSDADPLPRMIENAKRLETAGAELLVMPCNTAHYFYDAICAAVGVPMLNIIRETVGYAKKRVPGLTKLGILATEGTLKAGSYQQACRDAGIEGVEPGSRDRRLLMRIIYDQVKAGKPVDSDCFMDLVDRMRAKGCQAVVLGCTELSVIGRDLRLGPEDGVVDSMEVLAVRAIEACGRSAIVNEE